MRVLVRAALAVLAAVAAAPASAAFHLWQINEFYSNAAGNVQFVELTALSGGQQFLNGHTITSSNGMVTNTFMFPSDLPSDTAGKRMVIGTQSFAALGVVAPDYIVPDNFFFRGNFTINFAEGFDVWNNSSGAMTVPTDGVLSLARNGVTDTNSPLNFAGVAATVFPLPQQMDVNGDARSDIAWHNAGTGQVYRMAMNGFTIAAQAMVYHEPNTAWVVVAEADFNGDGVGDLLWRNTSTGQVYLMPFTLAGTPAAGAVFYTEPNPDWRILHTPDLNGDGKADLLWWNIATGQVYAMVMDGPAIAAQGLVYTEPNNAWRVVAVGDFARSGRSNQLIWHNSSTGQVYHMVVQISGNQITQTGTFIYHEPNTNWRIIGAADFTGDLRTDLLWRNTSTGQVYVMPMNGTMVGAGRVVHTEPNADWIVMAQGDYDGDFKADLLWRNVVTGQVFMMRMGLAAGLPAVAEGRVVYTEASSAWQLLGAFVFSNRAQAVN